MDKELKVVGNGDGGDGIGRVKGFAVKIKAIVGELKSAYGELEAEDYLSETVAAAVTAVGDTLSILHDKGLQSRYLLKKESDHLKAIEKAFEEPKKYILARSGGGGNLKKR